MKKLILSKVARGFSVVLLTSALSTIITSPSASAVTQNLTYDCYSTTPVTLYVNPDDLLTFTGSCGAVIAGTYNNILLSKLSFAFTGPQEFRVSATATPGTYTNAIDLFAASHTLYTIIVRGTDNAAAELAAQLAAQKAAEAKREAEKKAARTEITKGFSESKMPTIQQFATAEISGVTEKNLPMISKELMAMTAADRSDIKMVEMVSKKYRILDAISQGDKFSTVTANDLSSVGLIPKNYQTTVTNSLRSLPASQRDDYTKITAAINEELAVIRIREERLASVLALRKSRQAA
jgi:hypothetical protein